MVTGRDDLVDAVDFDGCSFINVLLRSTTRRTRITTQRSNT
jgi:hypothetical protein